MPSCAKAGAGVDVHMARAARALRRRGAHMNEGNHGRRSAETTHAIWAVSVGVSCATEPMLCGCRPLMASCAHATRCVSVRCRSIRRRRLCLWRASEECARASGPRLAWSCCGVARATGSNRMEHVRKTTVRGRVCSRGRGRLTSASRRPHAALDGACGRENPTFVRPNAEEQTRPRDLASLHTSGYVSV